MRHRSPCANTAPAGRRATSPPEIELFYGAGVRHTRRQDGWERLGQRGGRVFAWAVVGLRIFVATKPGVAGEADERPRERLGYVAQARAGE